MRKPRRPAICGLDMSLTYPAACIIPEGWRLGEWSSLIRLSWEPPEPHDDHDRFVRIIKIVGKMRDLVLAHGVKDVAVEGYAFSRNSSSVTKLAELGGYLRCEFLTYGRVVKEVPSSHARKVLLGKLPRSNAKGEVQHRLLRAGADWATNDNEADAFAVANAHLSDLGHPCVMLHE